MIGRAELGQMRLWWLGMVGVGLAGCSWLDSPRFPSSSASIAPEPRAIEQAVFSVVKSTNLAGNPQISPVRRANVTALADWIVCLRGDSRGAFQPYALFFRGDQLVDYRLAVLADDCGLESYLPLRQ
jgi:hypothetical protein